MSRFYDALKQAGRTRAEAGTEPAAEEWDSWIVTSPATRKEPKDTGDNTAVLREALSATWPQKGTALEVPPVQRGPEPLPESPIGAGNGRIGSGHSAAPIQDQWVISAERDVEEPAGSNTLVTATIDRKLRVIPNSVDPALVEYYRRLRTKLVQQHAQKPYASVLVTSAGPREGKTVTTLNLAFSFAMLQSIRVLVVDADLRRGTLGRALGINDRPGLSNLIEGSAGVDDVILKADDLPFDVVVAGDTKVPAGELLQSSELKNHIGKLSDKFSLVLVDSPPVNAVTDAQLLAGACDAVLLVSRAFATTRKALEKAAQDLHHARLLGAVLNGGTRAQVYRGDKRD